MQKINSIGTVKSAYAEINGIKMYYEIQGQGKPLVLVHGGGSTIETAWSKLMPLLAKNYKVIAVELQAHGHTSDRNAPVTFEQDADDVSALLKHLEIEKAYLFGFSNGGSTVMQMAVRNTAQVEKLIIASTGYQRDGFFDGFFEMMNKASLESMPQPLKDGFLKINPDSNALLAMHDKDRDRMIHFKDWSDDVLKSISVPAMVMIGNKDIVKFEHAIKMSRLLPQGELVIIPGLHGEALGDICTGKPESKLPEASADIINEFFSRN